MEELSLSIPKPSKTGLMLLDEIFESMVGGEKTVCVVVQWSFLPKIDFWRVAQTGIAAGFLGVPIKENGLEIAPLDKKLIGNISSVPLPQDVFMGKEEYGEIAPCGFNPRSLVGNCDFEILFHIGQQLQDEVLVLRWVQGKHRLGNLCFGGYYRTPKDLLMKTVVAADHRLTYRLNLGSGAATKYVFATPLTELSYPITCGWRQRDGSFVLEHPFFYKYKTLKKRLEPAAATRQLDMAGKLNRAIQRNWEFFEELFGYWERVDEELEKLNQEYYQKKRGGCHD